PGDPRVPHVTIHVSAGDLQGRDCVCDKPAAYLVGRADDCDIQVSPDNSDREVSRHHCLLEVIPPTVRLCDLGSTNGTFVNGARVGRRQEPDNQEPFELELKDGDRIQLGKTVLSVSVNTGS